MRHPLISIIPEKAECNTHVSVLIWSSSGSAASAVDTPGPSPLSKVTPASPSAFTCRQPALEIANVQDAPGDRKKQEVHSCCTLTAAVGPQGARLDD